MHDVENVEFKFSRLRRHLSPSCTKVFGSHTSTKGGGGGGGLSRPPPMISETVDSTTLNFGRLLGLSMRGKKLVELLI